MSSFAAPRLRSTGTYGGYSVAISSLPELTSLDLHGLVELPTGLYLQSLGDTADTKLDLDLSALTTVRGDFHVVALPFLEDFDGFSALALVEGPFGVTSMPGLTDLTLPKLKKVSGGRVDVGSNAALANVNLGALTSVASYGGYSIAMSALPELTSLDLHGLVEIPAGLYLQSLGDTADAKLDLDLTALTTVRGDFHVVALPFLEDFNGFSALALVEGPFGVTSMPGLTDLTLPKLKKVSGGRVDVSSNAALAKINLGALTSVASYGGYSIAISALPELTSLDLHGLVEIPAGLYLQGLGDTADAKLDLNLTALTTVRGDFHVVALPFLEDFDGFSALALIEGPFGVTSMPGLTDLALPKLKKVSGGRVDVGSNPVLASINLGALTSVASYGGYSIAISALPELTSLDLHGLVEIPAGLYLQGLGDTADAKLDLDLTALTTIRGDFHVVALPFLENFDGFSALALIEGPFGVTSMPGLTDLALPKLKKVSGGRVDIGSNAVLANINLSALTSVGTYGGYSIAISALPELSSLDLHAMVELPGGLYLQNLGDTAETLAITCSGLTTIRGPLNLGGCSTLSSLAGFAALTSVLGDFTVTSNEALSNCAVEDLAVRAKPTGTVNTSNNLACN